MLKAQKKEFVNKLQAVYGELDSMIITHYHGLSVGQITTLRNSLRETGSKFKIVKNTLSKLATNNTTLSQAATMFNGPVAIIYSDTSDNSLAAVKKVVEFNKNNKNLQIIGGILNNQLMSENQLQQVAKLPSLLELRGKIVGVLQAPAANILRILQAPHSAVARVIQAYANK